MKHSVLFSRFAKQKHIEILDTKQFETGCKWICTSHCLLVHEVFDAKNNPTESIIFDAPNVLRFGNDLLYLKAQTGNVAGASMVEYSAWQRIYSPIWEDVYAYAHIYSTIQKLNEGTILLNKQRVTTAKLPKFLKKWKKI